MSACEALSAFVVVKIWLSVSSLNGCDSEGFRQRVRCDKTGTVGYGCSLGSGGVCMGKCLNLGLKRFQVTCRGVIGYVKGYVSESGGVLAGSWVQPCKG